MNHSPAQRGTPSVHRTYGTNHDARRWQDPEAFRPDRFRGRDINAFDLIPQGGGDFLANHRCAGEWITIALMKRAVRLLADAIDYAVPALPRSGFVVAQVRRAA